MTANATSKEAEGSWSLAGRSLTPAQLRRWLEEHGPAAIKIGQFLSLRPDLLPQAYCDELLRLLDEVPHFPWSEAEKILTEDWGAPPDRRVGWIDKSPLAAGSLAQVHLARTLEGEEIAVKIRRPGIEALVARDLGRTRWLTRILKLTGVAKTLPMDEVLSEFGSWLEEELDFERELRNLTELYELNRGRENIQLPRPHPELSTKRVVTAEHLRGIPVSELLKTEADTAPDTREGRPDKTVLGHNLLTTVFHQMFDDQVFHADVHPGNLLALEGNTLGFVDFGLVGRIDEVLKQRVAYFLEAVYSDDIEQMYHALRELFSAREGSDMGAFREAFTEETRAWMRSRGRAAAPGARSSLSTFMITVLRLAREHRMRVPRDLLAIYRTLLTTDSVGRGLSDEVDVTAVARDFFLRWRIRNAIESMEPAALMGSLDNLLTLTRDGAGYLNRILADLADERLQLGVRVSDSVFDRTQANTRARLVATSVCSVSLTLLLLASEQVVFLSSSVARGVLSGMVGLSYAVVFWLWRKLS